MLLGVGYRNCEAIQCEWNALLVKPAPETEGATEGRATPHPPNGRAEAAIYRDGGSARVGPVELAANSRAPRGEGRDVDSARGVTFVERRI